MLLCERRAPIAAGRTRGARDWLLCQPSNSQLVVETGLLARISFTVMRSSSPCAHGRVQKPAVCPAGSSGPMSLQPARLLDGSAAPTPLCGLVFNPVGLDQVPSCPAHSRTTAENKSSVCAPIFCCKTPNGTILGDAPVCIRSAASIGFRVHPEDASSRRHFSMSNSHKVP
jgi:hypothetical protein